MFLEYLKEKTIFTIKTYRILYLWVFIWFVTPLFMVSIGIKEGVAVWWVVLYPIISCLMEDVYPKMEGIYLDYQNWKDHKLSTDCAEERTEGSHGPNQTVRSDR